MKAATKLSVSELRKGLNGLSQPELVDLVIKCSGLSREVESYLAVRFKGREAVDQLYERYRKRIEDEFFPDRGDSKLRLGEMRKAIREFQRICNDRKMAFDLTLFCVEMGVDFTNRYGDGGLSFYNSMLSIYTEVVKWINAEEGPELYLEYRDRLLSVVRNAKEGWGFRAGLDDLYNSIRWVEDDDEMEDDE